MQRHYLRPQSACRLRRKLKLRLHSIDPKVAAAIQDRVAKSGADVGIAFETLDGRLTWSSRGDDVFHAASTMKIPVMIELFHQVREGEVKLSDPLPIKNEFHSLVDGSVFKLKPEDDSETDLYKSVGQTRTLDQLCDLMVTVSSNFATNLLIQKLGIDNIRATVTCPPCRRHGHQARRRRSESLRQRTE